ncbi:MAG TPA: M20/M25/M40 family metallo-hydrolase [Thermoanaerobaculia bacterium]|nr:M20/M25/M40 family metallo-hydrolase [Thermoanaerobaculia bacterium]
MISFKGLIGATAILAVVSLQCRKAEGVAKDPLLDEAENALVAYVQIDTSNPPGNETAGAQFLQQLLVKEGIDAKLVGSDPARQSVYARLSSGTNEKALVLLHHIDVVPANPSEWARPPFSGARDAGYIWGRGALDVKSLGIAQLMALVDLKRRKAPLTRDIIYLGVADEELGGLKGAGELVEKHPELFENVGFVINEGGYNETVVDKITFWGIEIQQKIPLFLRMTAKGMPGHSASPPDDGGTVARLARAMNAVMSIPTPYRLNADVQRYFHLAGRHRNDPRGALIAKIAEPLDIAQIERVLTPGYKSLLRTTITLTRVSGGFAVNAIPATASADVDIRLLPDDDPQRMIARVKTEVGEHADVEVLLESQPVAASPVDTELYAVLAKAMKADEPGSAVEPIVGAGTSDSRFFRARGIVAYGIAPFKVNYYDADNVHGADERIRARFFAEGVQLVRRIVTDFCAAPK